MEGFGKGLSSPLQSTGENNENVDSNHDKLNPKFQGQKKMPAKHFMSPTISASSKATGPRKKILAERNESRSSFDTQSQKNSNLYMKKSPRNSSVSPASRIVSLHNRVSKPNENGDSSFVASPGQVYDPVKNYFSPRPKYLRFNPNRRLQILNRLEKEGRMFSLDSEEGLSGEEESSVEEIKDSSLSPSNESVVKDNENSESGEDEDGGIGDECEEEEDEEDEEEYGEVEEKRWCFSGALKLVTVLLACLLSTSYICSMNSPVTSPAEGAVWNLRDGYFMVKNQTLDIVSTKMQVSGFLKVEDNCSEPKEVDIDVDGIEGENEEIFGEEMEEKVNDSEDENDELGEDYSENEEAEKDIDDNNGEYEDGVKDQTDEAAEEVKSEIDGEFEQVSAAKNDESHFKSSNVNMIEVPGTEGVAETEVVGGVAETEVLGGVNNVESLHEFSGSHEKADDVVGGGAKTEVVVGGVAEIEVLRGVDNVESLHEFPGSHEKADDVGCKVDATGYEKTVESGLKYSTGFGFVFVAVSLILTSLTIIGHLLKRSRNVKPDKFAVKEEKVASLRPSSERKIEFFSRPSLPHTAEEASRGINHHLHAPNVELIGEIDFSLRNYAKKEHTNQSEEKNASFSTTCFDSYGRFTTETMILKKEGGQSREAMVEVTPVRRSSRLRNRAAITSP